MSIGEHLDVRRVRISDFTKAGTLWNAENEFLFQRCQTRCGLPQRNDSDTGADDARDDHESERHKNSDDTVPIEPSPGSGVKRSNLEALRRTDAQKALKRAKMLKERRAAKRASATPIDELEESATNAEVTVELAVDITLRCALTAEETAQLGAARFDGTVFTSAGGERWEVR